MKNEKEWRRSIVVMIWLILSVHFVCAQTKVDSAFLFGQKNMLFDYTKEEIGTAAFQVNRLRTSPLVVRLKTNKHQIKAYRDAGQTKVADRIAEKSLKINLRIISSCIKFFNYCPIYFLDTEDKDLFQQSDSLKVSNLIADKDTFIMLKHDSVYYLDYGNLFGRERSSEWKYKDYGKTKEGSIIISEDAFVIRNNKGDQLSLPMPFYTLVTLQGGKQAKEQTEFLENYIHLDNINSNSVIRKEFQKVNEFDAAVIRLNRQLIEYYVRITKQSSLANNSKYWYENNPNKYLYPLWITIEKKLLSIQEKDPQFMKQN